MTEILYNIRDNTYDTIKISEDIKKYRDKTCRTLDTPTCRIDENKIRNISHFFTSVITKCPATDITLNDVRQLEIIGKGTFGYGVSLPNKIVKIIICESNINQSLLNEIKYNKIITNSKNEHFIKLLGYFVREDNNGKYVYNYYDNRDNFTRKICFTKDDNLDNLCEIYLILEKADNNELYNYNKYISHNLLSVKINELLNMYKINKYFIDNYNIIFVHGDIKDNNIVVMKDGKLKIIDYGLSTHSKTFFFKSHNSLTYYGKLYGTANYTNIYLSPFYDIFCILFMFWSLYYNSNFNTSEKLYITILDNIDLDNSILSNKYLYILSFEIHMFFFKLYYYFRDTNLLNDFVNIKMIKYIYNNIFRINDLPEYIDTNNKLLDDYNYFNIIMTHMLTISKPYQNINRINVSDIFISYIEENINYSDIELFHLMKNILDIKIKEYIILKFSNNNFLDENKNNLLYYAIDENLSIDVIKKIIAKNIDINNINNNLDTVLSFAIKIKKSLELIKLLINNNSDINYIDKNEESIFHLLLKYEYNKIIEIMIDKFLYFNIRDINNNNELQHGIIKYLPQNILEKLIDKVNINNINKDGYNSLHLAIQNNYINIVKKLLEKNIDINTDINNKKSTIYLCLENDILDENILSIILEKTIVNKSISLSPINLGLYKKISLKIIDKMIDIFDINYVDENDSNSLLLLCILSTNDNFNEYFKLITKLINKDININHQNKFGGNAMAYLLDNKIKLNYQNKLILVNLLIENNIDLVCKKLNNPYQSLLSLALSNKLPEKIIEKFINKITINYVDEYNKNALFFALYNSYNINIIKKLIDNGINIKQIAKNETFPLMIAIIDPEINIDIIKLLIHPDLINIKIGIYYMIDFAITIAKRDINVIGLLLLNNGLLTDESIESLIKKYSEKEIIELIKISTHIKKNIQDYIIFFKKKYKSIDKHVNTEKYKKYKHIYKFLLTLKK